MAKQIGDTFITGTIDDLCFYKMDGRYYVRMKSLLTGKRVKKSAAFARTMESARQLATASVIASAVYRKIEKNKRKVSWFRKMTGIAKLLLKNGENKERITAKLLNYIATVLIEERRIFKRKSNKKTLRVIRPNICIQKRSLLSKERVINYDILRKEYRYRRWIIPRIQHVCTLNSNL